MCFPCIKTVWFMHVNPTGWHNEYFIAQNLLCPFHNGEWVNLYRTNAMVLVIVNNTSLHMLVSNLLFSKKVPIRIKCYPYLLCIVWMTYAINITIYLKDLSEQLKYKAWYLCIIYFRNVNDQKLCCDTYVITSVFKRRRAWLTKPNASVCPEVISTEVSFDIMLCIKTQIM